MSDLGKSGDCWEMSDLGKSGDRWEKNALGKSGDRWEKNALGKSGDREGAVPRLPATRKPRPATKDRWRGGVFLWLLPMAPCVSGAFGAGAVDYGYESPPL
ncbi:hypothetical protein GCM10009765_65600 [Fodinicola feengrottensis]|uniref:Uncharacterized protein n=1 Tax=Fodinicola feengrottensis TaxID=435914 RepID=A0ABN2IKW4_9ACTN